MNVSPAGTKAGVSEIKGTRPSTGEGRSQAFSLRPDPKSGCTAALVGGWQKCHGPAAMGTEYCVGHLRSRDPQRYKTLRDARGSED